MTPLEEVRFLQHRVLIGGKGKLCIAGGRKFPLRSFYAPGLLARGTHHLVDSILTDAPFLSLGIRWQLPIRE